MDLSHRRGVCAWPALLLLMSCPFRAGAAGPWPADAAESLTAEQLVDELGSAEFIRRQLATEALMELGLPALDAVKRGTEHADPEVRYRARQVMREIRHLDRQRLINAFASGQKIDAPQDLPGWVELQALAGDAAETRSLYVEMLEAEWSFLESVFRESDAQPNALLARRCQTLQDTLRLRRTVSVGSIAALLLAATRDDVDLSSQPYLMSFCYQRDFDQSMRGGSNRQAIRALLGSLIARDSVESLLIQRLHFALHYEMEEGLKPARRVLASGEGGAQVKQYALLVVNKLGDESDRKRMVDLLADRTVIKSEHRFNDGRISTQLRDLALACLLYHAKEDFRKYGLPPFQFHPTTVLNVPSIGFASDGAARQGDCELAERSSVGRGAGRDSSRGGCSRFTLKAQPDQAFGEAAGRGSCSPRPPAAVCHRMSQSRDTDVG